MRRLTYKTRIRVSTEDLQAAQAGRKTCTIRAGEASVPGKELDMTDGKSSTRISVLRVESKMFGELGDREVQGEGLGSLEELRLDLARYYPSLQAASPVTIIWFEIKPPVASPGG
jgi:hypothetical protein